MKKLSFGSSKRTGAAVKGNLFKKYTSIPPIPKLGPVKVKIGKKS